MGMSRTINMNMINTRLKRRKYGVASQNGISFLRADSLLQENGVVLNEQNKSCLFMHNDKESTKHWVIKALLLKILRGLGRTVGTEIETRGGVVDVLDADNLVGYEIETKINRRVVEQKVKRLWRLHDVIFIDAKKVPDDIKLAEQNLRARVV